MQAGNLKAFAGIKAHHLLKSNFPNQTTLIEYASEHYEKKAELEVSEILFSADANIQWLNVYGLGFQEEMRKIIIQNKLDDFLLKLLVDTRHTNKVIELEELLFIGIQILKEEKEGLGHEQMIFIANSDFVWSIQEKEGDYFNWIRERLEGNKGLVRRKKADYLLFLIMESIIDSYQENYEKLADLSINGEDFSGVKPTPEFTAFIEKRKQELFDFKKGVIGLRDTLIRIEKTQLRAFRGRYFGELKEQANNLIGDIDFDLQSMESKINLIFSIQGHRLNEVMKTLTIFSVIFIPLTFVAGIYGMNFKYMPELELAYGYPMVLGLMVLVLIFIIWYVYRKKWF